MLYKNIEVDRKGNTVAAIDKKNKMITILEKQIKDFQGLRADYDKLMNKKMMYTQKCNQIANKLDRFNEHQGHHQNLTLNLDTQLKGSISKLQSELKEKKNILNKLLSQNSEITVSSQSKDFQSMQKRQESQCLKNQQGKLIQEKAGLFDKITKKENQLKYLVQCSNKTQMSIQQVKSQCIQATTYMRNLKIQQEKVKKCIEFQKQRNGEREQQLQVYLKYEEVTFLEQKKLEEEKQKKTYNFKSGQIKLGRIKKQIEEKRKLLKLQTDKESAIKSELHKKNSQKIKLIGIIEEVEGWIGRIENQNIEIRQVNQKMRIDFEMCKQHRENLTENNCILNKELTNYENQNRVVIKKLESLLRKTEPNPELFEKKWLFETESTNFGQYRETGQDYRKNSYEY